MTDKEAPFKAIVRLLPVLARSELEALKERINSLLQFSDTSAHHLDTTATTALSRDDSDVTLVLSCVSQALRELGVEHCSVGILQRNARIPAFKRKVPALMKFIRRAFPESRQHQQALICLGVRLLRKNLMALNVPVTSGYVLQMIHRVPAVLDNAFPSYAEHGLFQLVIRSHEETTDVWHKPGRKPDAGNR